EVSNALIASSKSREIRESRKKLEQASRSALDLATLQYINGITNYLDVLDAQRSYFDAQIGLNNAIRDELLATVQLYKVLGGGDE
ncbi:TolC family protein, partial [Acinetobacter sp. 163]|nr:TolC family protein [Acinetobacter sp. 163]